MIYFGLHYLTFFCFICICCSQVVNVALHKPTEQFNTTVYMNFSWTSDKAVDGCLLRDDPDNQKCCSSSTASSDYTANFWKVNLTRKYKVARVNVFGRVDQNDSQISGFDMYITQEPGGYEKLIHHDTSNDTTFDFTYSSPLQMSEIIIRRNEPILTLCEVQIFASCDSGFFGVNCSQRCGHCFGNTSCNATSGSCPAGCDFGWKGARCNVPCNKGEWGPNCGRTCPHCKLKTCDTHAGVCSFGCKSGWVGNKCDSICARGRWGSDCSNACGQCVNGTACHHANGSCFGMCDAGWQGEFCTEQCEFGTWGRSCNFKCGHCSENITCHTVSGKCGHGCLEGWYGSSCFDSTNECEAILKQTEESEKERDPTGLYIAVGVLSVIAVVSVGFNVFVWKRLSVANRNAAAIRDQQPNQTKLSLDADGYDDLNGIKSHANEYDTIVHEYENGAPSQK